MEKKYFLLGIPILVVFLFVVLANPIGQGKAVSDGAIYEAYVCVEHARGGDVLMSECSHNLLTDVGAELIEQVLGQGATTAAFDYIGLCNATAGCTAPAAGDTALDNELAAGGMTRAQGAYVDMDTGYYSIWKTFTATAAIETNVTGLFNASSSGGMLAINNFTLASLQADDTLKINWTINITDA